jgi:type VI secretion system secreted protein Hcp
VAVADIFLTIKGPDIVGESQDDKHKDQMEILSFSWGVQNIGTSGTGTGAGGGASKPNDVVVTKYVDKASNVLMQGCSAGTHYTSAQLSVRKAGGDPLDYLVFDLGAPVFLSGYSVGGAGEGVVPVETVTINFASMNLTYNPQAPTGGTAGAATVGYHFAKGVKT